MQTDELTTVKWLGSRMGLMEREAKTLFDLDERMTKKGNETRRRKPAAFYPSEREQPPADTARS